MASATPGCPVRQLASPQSATSRLRKPQRRGARFKVATLILLCASSACSERVQVDPSGEGAQENDTVRRAQRDDAVRGTPREDSLRGMKTPSADPGRRTGSPVLARVDKKVRSFGSTQVVETTGGILDYELRPSYEGKYVGASFQTNKWGMRDRDYNLARPPGVFRIALLGSSYAMAPGVPEEQSFATLLETNLNAAAKLAGSKQRYEILNFGVGGYSLLQNVVVAEKKVLRFNPNAVLVALETTERNRSAKHLMRLVGQRVPIPYPGLDSILRAAEIVPGISDVDAKVKLLEQSRSILEWHFKQLQKTFKKRGVLTLGAVLPTPNAGGRQPPIAGAIGDIAEEQGFLMLETDEVFKGQPRDALLVSPNATQLSALAHRLIAETLERELRKEVGEQIGLAGTRNRSSQPGSPAPGR